MSRVHGTGTRGALNRRGGAAVRCATSKVQLVHFCEKLSLRRGRVLAEKLPECLSDKGQERDACLEVLGSGLCSARVDPSVRRSAIGGANLGVLKNIEE